MNEPHYYNSTFKIREDAKRLRRSQKPMKRSSRLRPIRKTREGSDARLKQDLTKALSIYVQMRDPICIVCGRRRSSQAGHLFHRDMPSVEFDPRNVWGICSPCNYRHETEPHHMRDQVFQRLGERGFDDLCTLAHDHKMKLGRAELELLLAELTEKIEDQTRSTQ